MLTESTGPRKAGKGFAGNITKQKDAPRNLLMQHGLVQDPRLHAGWFTTAAQHVSLETRSQKSIQKVTGTAHTMHDDQWKLRNHRRVKMGTQNQMAKHSTTHLNLRLIASTATRRSMKGIVNIDQGAHSSGEVRSNTPGDKYTLDSGEIDTACEPTVDWAYAGHGEWEPTPIQQAEIVHQQAKEIDGIQWDPGWVHKWRCSVDADLKLHEEVLRGGYPNRWGARRPVHSKWNLELFGQLLEEYEDKEVVEWLRYGWPSGRLPSMKVPTICNKNHAGASDYPEELRRYVRKELSHGAVMGPFKKIPFRGRVGISPLSSRPKKGSTNRCIILDLSFSEGSSVNDGMFKDNYLGFKAKLTFPKVDEFSLRIFSLGKNCLMFKVDISRYFWQLPLDPGDYSLIGYIIDGELYFDKVLPMGMRTAPYIAQRVTNAIAYIHRSLLYFLLNYVDDFVETKRQRSGPLIRPSHSYWRN